MQLVLICLRAAMLPCAGMPFLRRPALPKATAPTFQALAGSRQHPSLCDTEPQPDERDMWDGEAHKGLQVQPQKTAHRAAAGQGMKRALLIVPDESITTSSSPLAAQGLADMQQERLAVAFDKAGRSAVGLIPSLAAQQQPASLGHVPLQAGQLGGMVAGSARQQIGAVPEAVQNPGKPVDAAVVLSAAAVPAPGSFMVMAVAAAAASANAAEASTVDNGRVDSAQQEPGSTTAQHLLCSTGAQQQVGTTAAVHGLRGSMEEQQVVQTRTASQGSRKRKHAHALGPAAAPPAPGSSCSTPRGQVQAASTGAARGGARSTRAAGLATSAPAGRGEAATQAESGSDCMPSGSDDASSSEREASSTDGEKAVPKRRRTAAARPTIAELRAR